MMAFKSDAIGARWQHNIPGMGVVTGSSFTRNKRFDDPVQGYKQAYNVKLVVDQSKLSRRHKIVPVNAELLHRSAMKNNSRRSYGEPEDWDITKTGAHAFDRTKTDITYRMDEEFVIGDIKNLHEYVNAIIINKVTHDPSGTNAPFFVLQYAKDFKIPIKYADEQTKELVTKAVAKIKKRLAKKSKEVVSPEIQAMDARIEAADAARRKEEQLSYQYNTINPVNFSKNPIDWSIVNKLKPTQVVANIPNATADDAVAQFKQFRKQHGLEFLLQPKEQQAG
jgi:hypothetical protein